MAYCWGVDVALAFLESGALKLRAGYVRASGQSFEDGVGLKRGE